MNMRLPDSGSVIESLLGRLGASPGDDAGGATAEGVTEAEIALALDAMLRGDIEHVILENGDEFLQTADAGAGRYALQFSAGDSHPLLQVPGGTDADTMRKVMLSYGRGDLGWRGALAWAPM